MRPGNKASVATLTRCPLYNRFPELDERLPRLDLCRGFSPVRPLSALEQHLGRPGLWVKNDGLLGAAYGGNKVRKLEFVLADVLRRRASTVLTSGGTGSHHCLATAIYARQLEVRLAAVLLEQPETDEVRVNLRLLACGQPSLGRRASGLAGPPLHGIRLATAPAVPALGRRIDTAGLRRLCQRSAGDG